MKYPYIGKSYKSGCTILFTKTEYGFCTYGGVNKQGNCHVGLVGEYSGDWDEGNFKNITREYLANTYGKVESKEHAEFIVELCRIHGIPTIYSSKPSEAKSFEVNKGYISLHSIGINELNVSSQKLITIPLPPKQIQTATSEEEFEMKQIMKNNGDNLVLGCEDSKYEEWPCVGDEVCWSNGKRKGELKSICEGWAWIKDDSGEFVSLMSKYIKKPKAPEEELRDDLIELYCTAGYETEKHIDLIMSKYNITKKPQ